MSTRDLRVGYGFDIHRLELGRPLILGGVGIQFDRGLAGHSDADVIVHAIMDAILGAAGLPDIGAHFPNTEEQWRNASSLTLLKVVMKVIAEPHWQLMNLDATLIAEAPKIAPYVPRMKERLSAATGLTAEAIAIKATTAEGLGPEGRGEGMSARAVALLARDS